MFFVGEGPRVAEGQVVPIHRRDGEQDDGDEGGLARRAAQPEGPRPHIKEETKDHYPKVQRRMIMIQIRRPRNKAFFFFF